MLLATELSALDWLLLTVDNNNDPGNQGKNAHDDFDDAASRKQVTRIHFTAIMISQMPRRSMPNFLDSVIVAMVFPSKG